MNVGIQISSFKPLMTDERSLGDVLRAMSAMGCEYTQLQWIDRSIDKERIAELLEKYRIRTVGVQDKSEYLFSDCVYYLGLCRACGGGDVCFSGIPGGDASALSEQIYTLKSLARVFGFTVSYHPVKADLPDACEELMILWPELGLTVDVCQMYDAGVDCAAFIRRYEGNISTVHFKDRDSSGALCPVGSGVIDFESTVKACLDSGVETVLVEQESWKDPFNELASGFIYTKALIDSAGA